MKTKNITLIIILLALAAFIGVYLYFDKSADDSDDSDDSDDKDTDDGNTNTNPNTNIPTLDEVAAEEAEEHAKKLEDFYRHAIMIGVTAENLPNIANASNTR